MSFLPDPAELDALADRISAHAAAARARALGLASCVAAVGWHGIAANAFALEAHAVVAGLRAAAGRLDDTADALRRHARRVSTARDAVTGAVGAGLPTIETIVLDGRQLLDDARRLGGS